MRFFLAACLLKVLLLAPPLVRADFEWSYPAFGGDGPDWLSNGLAMAGESVPWSGRQPGLPLLLAALARTNALPYFPWISIALGALIAVATFDIARRALRSELWAWCAGSLVLLNDTLTAMSFHVMADTLTIAACTGSLALALGGRSRVALGLGAGAGCCQLAGGGFAAAAVLGAAGWPRSWAAALRRSATAGALIAPGLLAGLLVTSSDRATPTVPQDQRQLLRPALDRLDDFALWTIAVVGVPILALAVLHWLRAFRAARSGAPPSPVNPLVLPALAWFLATMIFFGVLYDWRADRFAAYGAVPLILMAVAEISCWSRRSLRTAGVVACAIGSMGTSFLVPLRGARVGPVDFTAARARAAAVHSVVAVVEESTTPAERRSLQGRLSNALRQRVKIAPRAMFPDDWRGWGGMTAVEPLAGSFLSRYQPGGSSTAWLFFTAFDPRGAAPAEPASAPTVEAWLRRMRNADALLDGRDGLLAVAVPASKDLPAARWAVLTTRTAGVFVVRPEEAHQILATTRSTRPARSLGPLGLGVGEYAGRRVVVLTGLVESSSE